jgi:hypothetical protein
LRERLERETRESEKRAAEVKAQAEADAAIQSGEWKKLAELRATELESARKDMADIEPVRARADRHETALKAILDEQRKHLPAHIVTLLDKLDVADQLEYIARNAKELERPSHGTPVRGAIKETPKGVPTSESPRNPIRL